MSTIFQLEAIDVTKQFPGTLALDRVKIQVKKGEIHALCGENGAGKSTLMNIVGGVLPATEGKVLFEGKEVQVKNTREAQKLGIGFVHQELNLCQHVSVGENIFIGRTPRNRFGRVDYKKLYNDSDAILSKLGAHFSSKKLITELNVSEQQLVEIAKSISMDCKLLILDEPTSSLTEKETTKLFEIMRELRDQGIAILYISHRLQEIFEVCDRVTVLKDGAYIGTMDTKDITTDDIIQAMVGRSIKDLYPAKNEDNQEAEELLRVSNLSGFGFKDISFSLRKGELLGFSGLVGAGRSEIMRGLCGIDRIKSGSIYFDGQEHQFKRYRDAVDHGICYLTEDRKLQGLFLGMSIKKNISSANLKAISNGLFINRSAEEKLVAEYVMQLAIKVAGLENPISSLSGGNQQKCLLGKWLSINPKVIIMDEPTRGIDVGAKLEIYTLLRALAEKGVGVIIVSSELPEVIGLCDRVAVVHEGDLTGFVEGKQITEENIMKLASGGTLENEVQV